MVKWGINGRPINEDNTPKKHTRQNPKKPRKPRLKQAIIKIINDDELITENMEILVLARLVDVKNRPISNAKIDVIDNNCFLKTLITSSDGYFTFYGGYIGRYHSFIFKFNGNKKFNKCNRSLVIA